MKRIQRTLWLSILFFGLAQFEVMAGTLPWEQTANTIASSISGVLLGALALVATVLIGVIWAFSPSEGVRRAGPALFGLSIAGGAALLLPALWDIAPSKGAEMPLSITISDMAP